MCYGDDWMRLGEYSRGNSMLEFGPTVCVAAHLYIWQLSVYLSTLAVLSFSLLS